MSDSETMDALLAQWDELRAQGVEPDLDELCADHPELLDDLRSRIEKLREMDWLDDAMETVDFVDEEPAEKTTAAEPRLLADRYRLEELIAEGGFARVWKAMDLILDREVAVKLTTVNCVEEARRVAKLNHQGIVSVHDVGQQDGYCFIVFDLIKGRDLSEIIAGQAMDWRKASRLIAEVGDHLQYAHEKGFIHRDIKPANILLDENERPILADFGIAVTQCELLAEAATTAGTLAYMAPEQLTGNRPVDVRTDVYGLGVVLYELLSGRLPFDGEHLSQIRSRIIEGEPLPVRSHSPDTPLEIEEICHKAMSKYPTRRFASASEMAEGLREVLERQPIS